MYSNIKRCGVKKIIFTADDYGMCQSVNKAIEDCVRLGSIYSTNVMVGMDMAEDAKNLRTKFPNLSIGLHWTLTTGRPVLPSSEIPSVVENDGFFYSATKFKKRWNLKKIIKNELKNELIAQYKKFTILCGEPDYWNTHENIHVNFGLFKYFVNIASELKIEKMRCHKPIYVRDSSEKKIKLTLMRIAKNLMISRWCTYAKMKGISMTDGVLVFVNRDDRYNIDKIANNILWNENKVIEMYVHPSRDTNCEYFGNIRDGRVMEYKLLNSRSNIKKLIRIGINIVGFEEVY